jgi:hypothetical protein
LVGERDHEALAVGFGDGAFEGDLPSGVFPGKRNVRAAAPHPEVAPALGLLAAGPGRQENVGQAAAVEGRELVRAGGADQVLNHRRPHKSLPGRATPAAAYTARPKATPGDRATDTHDRVRTCKIGTTGTVTLRHGGKLHHIGVGREHAGTDILLLVQDLHIRIIGAATGELLRELTLDPSRNYQPTGRKPKTP